jgi:hypothetical protein
MISAIAASCRFFTIGDCRPLGRVIDLDPGQALGAVDLDELGVGVDLAAAHLAAARHAQRGHAPARRGGGRREHLEVDVLHHVGQLGELQLHAQVRLVGAVLVHRVRIGHLLVHRQFHAHHLAEDGADHGLGDGADLLFGQERGLQVDLRELGLAVSTQVFVAEALGDLVITIKASDHQQLLEQLRRLRQREEHAVVHAAGHQVVARAFGCALREHRRLDVDEALLVEELAHLDRHLVAHHQVLLHLRPAQVQHAVRQAHGLAEVLVVELERRRHARVQHFHLMRQHLDLAAHQVGVLGAHRPRAHLAHHLQAELVAHAFGGLEHLGAVRVADDLHQAFAVAQVDEDDAAMVAAAVRPAHQRDGLAHQRFADQAAVGGSHGFSDSGDSVTAAARFARDSGAPH